MFHDFGTSRPGAVLINKSVGCWDAGRAWCSNSISFMEIWFTSHVTPRLVAAHLLLQT